MCVYVGCVWGGEGDFYLHFNSVKLLKGQTVDCNILYVELLSFSSLLPVSSVPIEPLLSSSSVFFSPLLRSRLTSSLLLPVSSLLVSCLLCPDSVVLSVFRSQEMFRQGMSSPVVKLEVLPVSNKLQYEKSLISQIFSSSDAAHTFTPKPKSPFLLRNADVKPTDPAPFSSSLTPPTREEPAVRRSPVIVERREQTPSPSISASPTPRSGSESPASTVNPAHMALANANKKAGRRIVNLTKGV